MLVMSARKRASTSDLLAFATPMALSPSNISPPGTARRDSPFRFGQERTSPTLRNSLRGPVLGPTLGLGSDREIEDRRPDGGVGDEAV